MDAAEAETSPDGQQPPPSGFSLKSDNSMNIRHDFTKETPDSRSVRSEDSAASTTSRSGDSSLEAPDRPAGEDADGDHQSCPELSTDLDALFELVEIRAIDVLLRDVRRYKRLLTNAGEDEPAAGYKPDSGASEGTLKITLHVLNEMVRIDLAGRLEKSIYGELDVCQRKLRAKLKRFEYIYEGSAQHGNRTLLNKVYTELYVTEGAGGLVNNQHEIRQIEAKSRAPPVEETPIKCEDIFKPLRGRDRFIRTVLTEGISGIGKTISVQKFNLDWAEGRANEDIQLLINLPFRELNLMKRVYTLTELLHHFLAEAKESGISDFGKYRLVLIFDGLDECRLPLDFNCNKQCGCSTQPELVDVLLTNLITGNLLPSAHIWITSRPAAAGRIPGDLVDRVTEIRGFNDPQKEEYFRKKIPDQGVAGRVIAHVKSARSLHIMCHIPVFSWISVTVLQRILETREDGEAKEEMPSTLTEMYTHFTVYNLLTRSRKYSAGEEASDSQNQAGPDEEVVLKLGRLAFENLMKGNMIFYESELHEYDIDVRDAATCSGLFTQISGTSPGLHPEMVCSFVHLSIQEYLASVFVFYTFVCHGRNLLDPDEATPARGGGGGVTGLLRSAVDEALKSNSGHLDLFLRFLLGLSQTSNQTLLRSVLHTSWSGAARNQEIIGYIRDKIRQNPSAERCINLFHCLIELNDRTLLEEVQDFLRSGNLPETPLTPSQWAALVFVLLTSKESLEEFDLTKYSRSEDGLLRLVPVIQESRVALLKESNLTEKCCRTLASLLSSSCMRELDLSDNDLRDEGVELLAAGLANSTCRLEKLGLRFCGVTETGCRFLVGALESNPAHLKELDLSYNHPGQVGTELLMQVQRDVEHLTVRLQGGGECYLKSALKRYRQELTLALNTADPYLSFSEDNKTMTRQETALPYPDGPERFGDWGQVLCSEALQGRCYWEAEWTGDWVGVGVAYEGISRKAKGNEPVLGYNDKSWSLRYCHGKYTAWYDKSDAAITVPYFHSRRVGVFLDWAAGTLSFYAVSSRSMTHLHTFHTRFTEPLYPGFRLGFPGSTLTLCGLDCP